MKIRLTLLSCLMLAASALAEPSEFSLVQVIVTYQEYDEMHPWQKLPPKERTGFGVVTAEGAVLTTERLVRNYTHVETKTARTGGKTPAFVIMADAKRNMALIGLLKGKRARNLIPVQTASSVEPDATLQMVQFDPTGEIERGEAQVLGIGMDPLPGAPFKMLTYKLISDMKVRQQGAPVFKGDMLAGLVIDDNTAEGTIGMLPASEIKRFLDDAARPVYPGCAMAGFVWRQLVDPAKRRYLGISKPEAGVIVLSALPGSGAGETLKPNDVITGIGGYAIDNQGFYEDPDFGRMNLAYIIKGRHSPGDKLEFELIRDRQMIRTNMTLTARSELADLIPENITGGPPAYIVAGGFVIRELTGAYLKSHGSGWRQAVNPKLVHMYLTRRHLPDREGERVVVVSSVLSDPINIGYQGFADMIIEEVNGESVLNIGDVFNIAERDGMIERLKLQGIDVEIALSSDQMEAANRRLANLYRIPKLWRKPAYE